MEPGLASVVPGKTVEDLARIAVQGLDDYLAEPDRIIIAIKRHNAENYKDQAHTEGCHQYAWVKGKGVSFPQASPDAAMVPASSPIEGWGSILHPR